MAEEKTVFANLEELVKSQPELGKRTIYEVEFSKLIGVKTVTVIASSQSMAKAVAADELFQCNARVIGTKELYAAMGRVAKETLNP